MLLYTEKGHGAPLVLLHGFCESYQVWEETQVFLSQHYRVICPHLPGFGSPITTPSINIEDIADMLRITLQHLGISKTVLIGHSMGGYISLAFAEKYPDYVQGIGLFHSTAFADTEERKEIRLKTIAFIREHGIQAFLKSFVPNLFAEQNRGRLQSVIENLINQHFDTEDVIRIIHAMRNRKAYTQVMSQLEVPVLLVFGQKDSFVTPNIIQEHCLLPSDSFVSIWKEAAHMGMYENPEATHYSIASFLRYVYRD